MEYVTTEKELAACLNNNQPTIEIRGELAQKIYKICSTEICTHSVIIESIGDFAKMVVLSHFPFKNFPISLLAIGVVGPNWTNGYGYLELKGSSCVRTFVLLGNSSFMSAFENTVVAGKIEGSTKTHNYQFTEKSKDRVVLTIDRLMNRS